MTNSRRNRDHHLWQGATELSRPLRCSPPPVLAAYGAAIEPNVILPQASLSAVDELQPRRLLYCGKPSLPGKSWCAAAVVAARFGIAPLSPQLQSY